MKTVAPIAIVTGSTLVSTNVGTGADPAAYNALANYDLTDRCVVGELVYESAQDGNQGHNPPDNLTGETPYWYLVGAINSQAMFDRRVGSRTVNPDKIEVELQPGMLVTHLSILNAVANKITVTQTDPVDGLVFTKEVNLIEPTVGWLNWLHAPIVRSNAALITGFKLYRNAVIKVVIDNTGSNAECGLLVVGQAVHPGGTRFGGSDGIDDYSDVGPDKWGVRDIVERDYADDAEFMVEVPVHLSPQFRRHLAARRTQPTLVIMADHRPDAQYYGLISFRRTFPLKKYDVFTVTVKGFT